jgi:hypothetical protein
MNKYPIVHRQIFACIGISTALLTGDKNVCIAFMILSPLTMLILDREWVQVVLCVTISIITGYILSFASDDTLIKITESTQSKIEITDIFKMVVSAFLIVKLYNRSYNFVNDDLRSVLYALLSSITPLLIISSVMFKYRNHTMLRQNYENACTECVIHLCIIILAAMHLSSKNYFVGHGKKI